MRITLVAGLPGSGKTTLLETLRAQGAEIVDDIVEYDALPVVPIPWLAVADVSFCSSHVREAAETFLRKRFPGCGIEWTFFENDPEGCMGNVRARDDGRNVEPDIRALTRGYRIPEGVEPLSVRHAPAPALR